MASLPCNAEGLSVLLRYSAVHRNRTSLSRSEGAHSSQNGPGPQRPPRTGFGNLQKYFGVLAKFLDFSRNTSSPSALGHGGDLFPRPRATSPLHLAPTPPKHPAGDRTARRHPPLPPQIAIAGHPVARHAPARG
jgi:hypothetical protein